MKEVFNVLICLFFISIATSFAQYTPYHPLKAYKACDNSSASDYDFFEGVNILGDVTIYSTVYVWNCNPNGTVKAKTRAALMRENYAEVVNEVVVSGVGTMSRTESATYNTHHIDGEALVELTNVEGYAKAVLTLTW